MVAAGCFNLTNDAQAFSIGVQGVVRMETFR